MPTNPTHAEQPPSIPAKKTPSLAQEQQALPAVHPPALLPHPLTIPASTSLDGQPPASGHEAVAITHGDLATIPVGGSRCARTPPRAMRSRLHSGFSRYFDPALDRALRK